MTERHVTERPVTERHVTERHVFEYALLRVVPSIERGEQINAGVVVYCRAKSFVTALTHLDEKRLLALDPEADVTGARAVLHAVERHCRGETTRARRPRTTPGGATAGSSRRARPWSSPAPCTPV